MRFYFHLKKFLFIFTIGIFSFIQNISASNNINIETDIYVQHDASNKDIYLLNSEGVETVVYKVINVVYTASKQWTRDGIYIDDKTGKISATSPNNYIKVTAGETYFVRLYGIGEVYKGVNGDEWHITTPIVYFDDAGNCVGHALSSTVSASKSGVEIIIPTGATRMYISNYNNQNISIQKKLVLNDEQFQRVKKQQDKILGFVDTNYNDIKSDPIIYSGLDKAYITFVNDDSRSNVDKFADLFISKKVPLCFAAVAENLLNNSSNLKETRLDVALRVQRVGGEILAHNAQVVTNDNINDNNFMYSYFVVQKQLLSGMGINVNGIILAGGNGQIVGSPITAKWSSALYKYSDLLGEKYSGNMGIDSVYYHQRYGLGNYNNDIEKLKNEISKAIDNKSWLVFYFHDINEISLDTLNELLDYINSRKNDVEVVTYNTMYQKFAKRESSLNNQKKTYYVSSNGTSNDGTDINNPINLDTLNKKNIKTGDTILFKSGDTFFGTLELTVSNTGDGYINISNYGKGSLPTISTYKYISNNWESYSNNIYRINIKDSNNYTGYTKDVTSAYNVGFLEDDNGNKYYNKKSSINALTNQYDFYSDGKEYLYMYANQNPYNALGSLKVVVRSNLMNLSSNMKISNIRFAYTGGHAMEGASVNEENIIITNCIFENIGGSYLHSSKLDDETRYGNGIEFYGSNARNITVKNNIFKNIYDVAFTIQGSSGSGKDIFVYDNVFINNSQDSEIWENDKATGVYNYQFYNNLSINQGRGWGYDARVDKYPAASILFWGYDIANTNISFKNNIFYNPRQIYYFAVATDKYFLSTDTISSDNNIYYMAKDTTIYRNNWNYNTKKEFISKYNVDKNSTYNLIEEDKNLTNQANKLYDISKIRSLLNKEKSIKSIELKNVPNNLKIKKGNTIKIDGWSVIVNYTDGSNDTMKLDNSMLSKINYEKLGNQTITVTYSGYTTKFNIEIIEDNKLVDKNNSNVNVKDDNTNIEQELEEKNEEIIYQDAEKTENDSIMIIISIIGAILIFLFLLKINDWYNLWYKKSIHSLYRFICLQF